MSNKQVGTQLYVITTPSIVSYVVRGGTWQEKDSTKTENQTNQNDETFSTTGWDPGFDVSCELFTLAACTLVSPPAVLDVLTEVSPGTRKWLVMSATRKNFAKKALITACELQLRTSQDLTLTS